MRILALILLALFWFAPSAQAKSLIADMSGYRIEIDSNFTGTRLLLFGTRNDTGDVIVAVRGPERDYIVRKKVLVGGLFWLNRKKQALNDVPSFYMVAASRPFKEIKNSEIFAPLGIGFRHIVGVGREDFVNAFLADQQTRRLYSIPTQKVSFMDESLFKLVLPFPDNVPRGNYSVDVYLINDGHLISMQSIPLQVERGGMDAFIYDFAHTHAVLYGFFATIMALAAGWVASRYLHK